MPVSIPNQTEEAGRLPRDGLQLIFSCILKKKEEGSPKYLFFPISHLPHGGREAFPASGWKELGLPEEEWFKAALQYPTEYLDISSHYSQYYSKEERRKCE